LYKLLFFIVLVFIGLFAFLPESNSIFQLIKGFDKLNHFLAFFTLSLLFIISFNPKHKVISILIMLIIGIIIEVIQPIFQRSFSLFDLVFNMLGILLSHLMY